MKLSWLPIACAALVGAGVANIDIKPQPTKVIEKPITQVKVKTVTRTKVVHDLAAVPAGAVSRAQCNAIQKGTQFRTIVAMHGWPQELNPMDFSDHLYYPLRHVKDQYCDVMFDNNQVDDVEVTY